MARQIAELEQSLRDQTRQLVVLQGTLAAALRREASLTQELERLRVRDAKATTSAAINRLHAKYGLVPSCEDFVFAAVRRAYQLRVHPDKYHGNKTKEVRATRQFQDLQADFAEMGKARGDNGP